MGTGVLQKIAQKGDKQACAELSNRYRTGTAVLPKDEQLADFWYQCSIGKVTTLTATIEHKYMDYSNMGTGVLQKIAQKGDKQACAELSNRYRTGTAVLPKDEKLADFWYQCSIGKASPPPPQKSTIIDGKMTSKKTTSFSKQDVMNAAYKLGRLVNGGVVGYYVGGKASQMMSTTLPDQIVEVVEKHKKIQLTANLAQSFIPGAGLVAMAAVVASLWKMYYDINKVLNIKINENAGKSITSAILTNFTSFGANALATGVSEAAKAIPLVGWIASAAISTVSTTAIIYGSAYVYLTALTKMYEMDGKFNLSSLESIVGA